MCQERETDSLPPPHPVRPTEKGSTAQEKSWKWGQAGKGARGIGTNCNHEIRFLHLWEQRKVWMSGELGGLSVNRSSQDWAGRK